MIRGKILNRIIKKDSKDEIFHSSGYARAQSGEAFGSGTGESFEKRREIDLNRKIVRGYGDSRVMNDYGKEAARLRFKTQREMQEKREEGGSSRFAARGKDEGGRFGAKKNGGTNRFAAKSSGGAEVKRAAMPRKNPGISR